jgi:hypothetical protein
MDKCPHCGSKNGHFYIVRGITMEYNGGWGQEAEWGETERTRPIPTFSKCLDCKKQVRRELAEGGSNHG